jgi:hypothetical protein
VRRRSADGAEAPTEIPGHEWGGSASGREGGLVCRDTTGSVGRRRRRMGAAHRLRYDSTSPTVCQRFGMDGRAKTTRVGPTSHTQMSSEWWPHSGLHYRACAGPTPSASWHGRKE